MTPKEKAYELVDKFMKYEPIKLSDYTRIEYPSAVNLAKICCYEIIESYSAIYDDSICNNIMYEGRNMQKFYQEVKKELNEL